MAYTAGAEALARMMALLPNAKEAVLQHLFSQCMDEFAAICNRDDVPDRAGMVIEQMVAYRYGQLNAEGLSGQNYSGMSEAFLTDYPEPLKRAMYRFRRLGMR